LLNIKRNGNCHIESEYEVNSNIVVELISGLSAAGTALMIFRSTKLDARFDKMEAKFDAKFDKVDEELKSIRLDMLNLSKAVSQIDGFLKGFFQNQYQGASTGSQNNKSLNP
jgi:hypothetical protein